MLIEFCAAQSISSKIKSKPVHSPITQTNPTGLTSMGPFRPWPVQEGGSPSLRLSGGQPSSTPGPAHLRAQALSARVRREAVLHCRKSRVGQAEPDLGSEMNLLCGRGHVASLL